MNTEMLNTEIGNAGRGRTSLRDPSIKGFCHRQMISRSSYYNLKAAGLAPREYVVGKLVRISAEAESAWILEREAAEDARRGARSTS